MITQKKKNKLFEMFMEYNFLTDTDLESNDFSNEDLAELRKMGIISSAEGGFYTLAKAQGLIFYSNILYKKGDLKRYRAVLERCLYFFPNNYTAANILFSESLIDGDFEKAFEYYEVMDKSSNEVNLQDRNLWLLLLSYVIEVPGQYIDRLSNLRIGDILISADDKKYSDKVFLNKIRVAIFEGDFDRAIEMLELSEEALNDKAYNKITRNLLYLAKENYHVDKNKDELYYDLVVSEQYFKLVETLSDVENSRRLTFSEFCLYNLAGNMVQMLQSGRVPKAKDCNDINFVEAIVKHNYELALQLNRCSSLGENCSNNDAVSLMLQRIIEKKDEVKFQRIAKQIGSNDFAKFYNDLMNNDIDSALEKLDVYLAKMGKSEYYSYILSLIKLSLVDEDRAYVAPMLALSSMNSDDFYFDVSTYLQDFYSAFATKDYKRAIVYLNILSSSEDIGGVVAIDTTEMKKALFDAIHEADINELDIVINIPGVKEVGKEKVAAVAIEEKEDVEAVPVLKTLEAAKPKVSIVQRTTTGRDLDELANKYGAVVNVVEQVRHGDNLVLLEPMSEEDTDNILYLVCSFPDLEVSVVDSVDSDDKHIMLRYNSGSSDNISGGDLIRAGNSAYYEKRYEDCVDYFEQFISGRGTPKSFIYAKLGLAYRAIGTNEGYRNAIDCLTIATSRSRNYYDGDYDFTRIVNELKDICGYNGLRVLDDKCGGTLENGVQYKKTDRE